MYYYSSGTCRSHNTKCIRLEDFFLLKLIIGGNRENVYLPEKGYYKRFSTIFEMGFRGTYKGLRPNIYSLIRREHYYFIKRILFCNLLIVVFNYLFNQNLIPADCIKKYGLRGCLTAWQAD